MMFGAREEFPYIECGACGCIQICDIPENMGQYYPSDYYSLDENPVSMYTPAWKRPLQNARVEYAIFRKNSIGNFLFRRYYDSGLEALSRVAGISTETSIADVGCGKGKLLYQLREYGFTDVLGIDPYLEKDIQYDNGLQIKKASCSDLERTFDVIMMHHAFEHVADPLQMLRDVSRALSPRGTVIIRIPLAGTYAWQTYGKDWAQLDPPRHFFLHTTESMRHVTQDAGFSITQTVFDSGTFQFWASQQYQQDIPLLDSRSYLVNPKAGLFSAFEIASMQTKAKELNNVGQGDQAIFYLQKT
jgi:SAM-dependent methyltransferase